MAKMDLGDTILQILDEKGKLDSYEFSKETDRDHQSVVGAIKSLQSQGNVSIILHTAPDRSVWTSVCR